MTTYHYSNGTETVHVHFGADCVSVSTDELNWRPLPRHVDPWLSEALNWLLGDRADAHTFERVDYTACTFDDAVELLKARREPNRNKTWVYYASEIGAVYRVTDTELRRLADLMEMRGDAAYSVWCDECAGILLSLRYAPVFAPLLVAEAVTGEDESIDGVPEMDGYLHTDHTTGVDTYILWLPDYCRAGIMTDDGTGKTVWTDAESAEYALLLYLTELAE